MAYRGGRRTWKVPNCSTEHNWKRRRRRRRRKGRHLPVSLLYIRYIYISFFHFVSLFFSRFLFVFLVLWRWGPRCGAAWMMITISRHAGRAGSANTGRGYLLFFLLIYSLSSEKIPSTCVHLFFFFLPTSPPSSYRKNKKKKPRHISQTADGLSMFQRWE